MKIRADILFVLEALAAQQRGVVTTSDLEVLFKTTHRQLLKSRLFPFLYEKMIIRFCRGYYVLPGKIPSEVILESLSQRLCPHSVISMGTVLSKERFIGTIPSKTIYAVKLGTTRKYVHPQIGTIIHFGLGGVNNHRLLTLSREWNNGICYADPEKSLLDTLYFYQKGAKFFFNIYSDVDRTKINREKYLEYLKIYPNSRFQTFARNYIHEAK